jgi:hypothetical protein
MNKLLPVFLLIGAGVGVFFVLKPTTLPEVTLLDEGDQQVTLSQVRGDKDALLITFLMGRCPLSKYTAGLLRDMYPNKSDYMEFVALVFGTNQAAWDLCAEWNLDFPCYGVREAPDPLAINALIEEVGSPHGARSAVTGGSVLLVDRERKLLFNLEREEVKELAQRLDDEGF